MLHAGEEPKGEGVRVQLADSARQVVAFNDKQSLRRVHRFKHQAIAGDGHSENILSRITINFSRYHF